MRTHYNFNNSDSVIAIVGAGLSGIITLCHIIDTLIEQSSPTHKIIIYEKDINQFATGVPYTTDCPSIWTLNNPASKLKLTSSGMTMAEWINNSKNQWLELFPDMNIEYPPRALVGIFLKEQYYIYKSKAKEHGIIVERNIDEVVDMDHVNDKWILTTANQQHVSANSVFLCLGHTSNNQFSHLKRHQNYFTAYSHVNVLSSIPNEAEVYIIGGQATYVDVALWLAYTKKHTGRIHTITRNAGMITSKGNPDTCDVAIDELTQSFKATHADNSLSLFDAKALLFSAYRHAAKHPVDLDNLPCTQRVLRYQMNKYNRTSFEDKSTGNIDELRSFIFQFYFSGCYTEFWKKLKDEDKELFYRQLYSFIFAYLTGITPLNAQLLLKLYERNLIDEKNGLTFIHYNNDRNRYVLSFANGSTEDAEYIIDTSGLSYDISNTNLGFPLLTNLVKKGYLVPGKFGGTQLNDSGQAYNRNGQLQPDLFCIGPTAAYCHPVPTPYASFIAIEMVEKALSQFFHKPASLAVFRKA